MVRNFSIISPPGIDFSFRWLNSCPVCGKKQEQPFEYPLGFCSRSCKILSLLEQFEDQEYTNRYGIEKFDEGNFLLLVQKDFQLSLTKSDISTIAQILGESNDEELLFSLGYNSRYWMIEKRLKEFFDT